ncbi:MAG: hypothetical protein UU95_C0026G0012 [Parcubacteria group bacterium GW2011_GWC2_42_12]|nr:MAG: hypothetical protein UU95_C0026G0012 [Parcubacteria group bacterium GW2011_GWC2_42_12]
MKYQVKPIKPRLSEYLNRYNLFEKWEKAKNFLANDLSHPSLNFEKIILKSTVFYSFRIDKKYRGICVLNKGRMEIILFTNHYK